MYRRSIDMSASNNVPGSQYGVSPQQLRELMELRGADALQLLQEEYESVEGVCQRLRTHSTEGQWRFLWGWALSHFYHRYYYCCYLCQRYCSGYLFTIIVVLRLEAL